MKILRGNLTETRYDFPDGDNKKPMQLKSETVRKENAVAYMADELGLHRMFNEGSDYAVSLHRRSPLSSRILRATWLTLIVYTPPNVAKNGCNIFDVKTGKMTHISKCGHYSEHGKRVQD